MDVAARAATAEDLDVLADLAHIAVEELRPRRGGQVWYRSTARHAPAKTSLQTDLGDSATSLAVGTIDGTIVGYGVMRIEEMRDSTKIGMLTDLFTLEGARGVGVGEAVMNLLIEVAADNDCTGVDSLALPGDRHTKNFFESFGLVARAIIVHRSLETGDDESA